MNLKQIHCISETTCSIIPIEPRKIIKKSINRIPFQIILGIILAGSLYWWMAMGVEGITGIKIAWYKNVLLLTFLGTLLIILIGNILYQFLYFRYYFYDLTSEVVIRKGVVSRTQISIRYEKIQNIFVDQDFWDRIFKLYDVHIATADPQSSWVAHIEEFLKKMQKN